MLNNRQKWHLSLNFIQIQAEFVEDDAKLALPLNFMQRCEAQARNDDKDTSLAILNGRLSLAETMLVDLDMTIEPKGPLYDASKQLEGMPWIQADDQQKRILQKLLIDNRPLLSTDAVPELSDLAAAVHISGDRLMEIKILNRISRRMNQVDTLRRDDIWDATNDDIVRRFTDLISNLDGRVILVASSISRLANTFGNTRDHTEMSTYLHKLASFEAAYPDFDVPNVQDNLYRGAAVALRELGRKEEAGVFEAKKMEALRNSAPDPSRFYRKYRDKPFDDWAPHLMELILGWIVADMKAGRLSTMQSARMLLHQTECLQVSDDFSEIDLGLGQPPGVLAERLYGSTMPIESGLWEQRLDCFETWLWHSPVNVKRYIRHTVLGDLQQARCASVTKYALRITNDPVLVLNETLQLDVLLMKKRENERLLHLIKRLDPNAMGASEHAISSQEWVCVCDQVNLATSFKAVRTGVIKDSDLQEAQRFFEQAYLSTQVKTSLID